MLITVYMVVGMIIKIFKYQASGFDIIPNIEFWKDLPFLVRDGVQFAISCGKTRRYTRFVEEGKEMDHEREVREPQPEVSKEHTGYGTM